MMNIRTWIALGTTLLFSLTLPLEAASATASAGKVLEIETLDRSANPATDFFQFANGGWLKNNPVPPDQSLWSEYSELGDKTLVRLREVAEAAAAVKSAPVGSPSQLVGDFYRAAANEAFIEKEGLAPLMEELNAINAVASRDGLLKEIAHLHSLGISPLFNVSVEQDMKNSARYIVQLTQGGLGLPDRDYYFDKDKRAIRDAYVAYITALFQLQGHSPAQAKKAASTLLKLETKLARASMTKVELRDPQKVYHLMTSAELGQKTPHLGWKNYFTALELADPGPINVGQPEFFRAVDKLIQQTSLQDWQVYLRWQLLDAMAPHLSAPFVSAEFNFHGRLLSGTQELPARWKRVVRLIDSEMGEALGQLYVARYFPPSAKVKVVEMVTHLRSAMRTNLATLEWMTPATRAQAIRKLDKMTVKIGYPDKWRDYSRLVITPDSHLANVLSTSRFEVRRRLARLGQPVDRSEWGMTPPTVNAYYDPSMNEMVFPAGVLQPPLFDPEADEASNYGNTGATIGHEMTHGFDDEGRQFDEDGNLRNWWSAEDEKNFLNRSRKIEQQFDAFVPIDTLHINGKLTAGENIADLGGVKIAYQALQKAITGRHPGRLDGFTPEQRFFITYAQSFRENIRPERLRLQLATDPHAPGKYRVLGPLMNLPEFSEAFKVPFNPPPAGVVQIW